MNINVSYAEMAFLRELVSKEKLRIWRELWLTKMTPNKERAIELFEEWDKKKCLGVPLDNLDCCRLLLQRFSVIEENIQAELCGMPCSMR